MAVAPDGSVWFTGPGVDRVGRRSAAGELSLYSVAAGANPQVVATDLDGAAWFAENGGNAIGRITADGRLTEFPLPERAASGAFSYCPGTCPFGVVRGQDDAIWFSETNVAPLGARIGRVTARGDVTEFPLPNGARPSGIALGKDGNLWFIEEDGTRLATMTRAGYVTEFPYPRAPALTILYGAIATAPDASVWLLVWPSGSASGGSQLTRYIPGKGYDQLTDLPASGTPPTSLAVAVDGSVWISQGDTVWRYRPAGAT
jgi:virginiamycin B lyase